MFRRTRKGRVNPCRSRAEPRRVREMQVTGLPQPKGAAMRRLSVLALALSLLVVVATPASAQEFDPHPHMLVLGFELDESGEPVGFRNCVDLAAGGKNPPHAPP